jgi:hypothetical protein
MESKDPIWREGQKSSFSNFTEIKEKLSSKLASYGTMLEHIVYFILLGLLNTVGPGYPNPSLILALSI